MSLVLETERLVMRPLEPADAEAFAAYRSHPEVAKYQSWDVPFQVAEARRFIEALAGTAPGSPGAWCQLGLHLKPGDELVGDSAFCVLADVPSQAKLGFTLAPGYQGRGLATEAATRVLDYLFGELGLHRVLAICDVDNARSVRVLERLGMRREAHLVDHVWFKGRWSSEYWYAIRRSEWAGPHAAGLHSGGWLGQNNAP